MSASPYVTARNLGPMQYDVDPYSAIGWLNLLRSPKTLSIDPLPKQINHYKFWKLGFGDHAYTNKPILSSVTLRLSFDQVGQPRFAISN